MNVLISNFAFLIDYKEGTLADTIVLTISSKLSRNLTFRLAITQEILSKSTKTFGPGGVAWHAIDRNTQNLGIIAFKAFEVGLVRRHLRRSDRCPG